MENHEEILLAFFIKRFNKQSHACPPFQQRLSTASLAKQGIQHTVSMLQYQDLHTHSMRQTCLVWFTEAWAT
jgi:hypothetical protein